MNKTKVIFLLLPIFSLFLISCTATSAGNDDEDGPFEDAIREAAREKGLQLPLSEDDFEKLPLELQEFELTYELLDMYYLYGHMKDELGSRNDYYAKAKGTPYEALPYGDIYYMFDQMSCPFTNYFDPSLYDRLTDLLYYSEYGVGFGFRLDTIEHTPNESAVISNVYPDGPAKKAGLMDGDIIVSVNNIDATREYIEHLEESCKNGDTYEFVIERGSEIDTVYLVAGQTQAPTVFVNYRGDIPMITITEFTDTTIMNSGTYGEFKEALQQTEGAKATIINLADNGGGSVDHCESMAAELLPKETLLGYTISAEIDSSKDMVGNVFYEQIIDTSKMYASTYEKTEGGSAKDRYIVFIENGNSASCAELMIAAVTNARNAPVVGTRSFGKGIGQFYIPTIAGGYAGITNVQFLDKNKNTYHAYGIEPDVIKTNLKDAVDAAFEIAKEGTMVRTAGYSDTPSGHFALTRRTATFKDPRNLTRRDYFGAFRIKKHPRHSK